MDIFGRYTDIMHHDLHDWAAGHAEASGGLLVQLPIDAVTYKNQSLLVHTVHGKPLDPGAIDSVANSLYEKYGPLSAAIDENEAGLTLIAEVLESGQNVVLGTDHVELIDIAFVMVRITTRLREMGVDFDSSILASKIIEYLGTPKLGERILPASEILGWALDEIYTTIPSTQSSKEKLHVPRKPIERYNGWVIRHGIEKRFKKRGRPALLGVALSGTINKPLDVARYNKQENPSVEIPAEDQETTVVIGRANHGITRFAKHALTVVAATQLSGEVGVTIDTEPICINKPEKVDRAMGKIAVIQNNNDPSHNYVYDIDGNLPVVTEASESSEEPPTEER